MFGEYWSWLAIMTNPKYSTVNDNLKFANFGVDADIVIAEKSSCRFEHQVITSLLNHVLQSFFLFRRAAYIILFITVPLFRSTSFFGFISKNVSATLNKNNQIHMLKQKQTCHVCTDALSGTGLKHHNFPSTISKRKT